MDINEVVQSKEYKFLFQNEHLKRNIMFLTFGGSHAYGTNIETSDIDIRGVTLNSKSDILGMTNFEQVVDNSTDTTVYSFNKLVSLLLNCNPNVIEMFGCRPQDYCYVSKLGEQMLLNKAMFLSKRSRYSFSGFATAQLRRLQNALARDSYPQEEKEKHICESIKMSMNSFNDRYKSIDNGSMNIYVDKSEKEGFETEIFFDTTLEHYPLRDFKNIMSDMNNIISDYDKLNKRNSKKDDLHLNKHAMHLVRIYLMGIDILEKQEIITYREKDHDLLMSIRNGKFQLADGTFDNAFFDLVDELEKRAEYAYNNTSLPNEPNYNMIQDFMMYVNEKVVTNDF